MAHIGSSQSERRKFGLDQSESRISPMWLIDVTTIVLAHVTPPEVTPQSPEVTAQPEVPTQPEVNLQLVPSLPEVSARPEVIVPPEVPTQPEVTP